MMANEHIPKDQYSNDDVEVIECEECGFKHQEPIPTEAEIRQIYESNFGGEVKDHFTERKQTDEDYWRRAFERRRLTYREDLNVETAVPSILDVGCGTGDLLTFFKENGWKVQGIEPSEHFHDLLDDRGIPNVPKLIEDITSDGWAQLGGFDVVNLSMVLEHVRDPESVVRTIIENALASDGILTIESPNDFNTFQETAVDIWDLDRWWIHELHINYFDFASLESLIRRCGLTPESRDAQFPLGMFLLFGDVYVGDDDLSREVHEKRVQFEKSFHQTGREAELRNLYKSLASIGLGRTAIIHART
jgi:SAM-dependent methyltransferase